MSDYCRTGCSLERIYVSNITKDEVMLFDDVLKIHPDYGENPLHRLVCDKGYQKDHLSEHQVGFIVTERQVEQIKEMGYCDVICNSR